MVKYPKRVRVSNHYTSTAVFMAQTPFEHMIWESLSANMTLDTEFKWSRMQWGYLHILYRQKLPLGLCSYVVQGFF